jgi:SAM-dependent methyltransferase
MPGSSLFETRNIAATGLSDDAFDGAASFDVLLFVEDKGSVLREIKRILKPGARFAGTTFELSSASAAFKLSAFVDYPAAFESAGLAVEAYEETEAWRELLSGVLSGILAREVDIARELHPASHERMRNWAKQRLPELDDTRRVRFCVRRPL